MSAGITGKLRDLRNRARREPDPDVDELLREIIARQHEIKELLGMLVLALDAGWVSRSDEDGRQNLDN